MTQPSEPPYAPPPSPSPATNRLTPPAASRRGCGSRILGLLGWLLTLALSAALGIAVLAGIAYFLFGFTLATPNQIRQANADVSALQAQVGALETAVALARTGEAEGARELSSANELLGELEGRLAGVEQQAADLAGQSATAASLAQELGENVALAATIQAEGREGQVLVAVVATVQADNAARIADLQQRNERVTRFLDRLSDLAGDVGGAPAPAASPEQPAATPSATPTAAPTAPAPTATPTPTPTS